MKRTHAILILLIAVAVIPVTSMNSGNSALDLRCEGFESAAQVVSLSTQ